jgi:hypothetical protein
MRGYLHLGFLAAAILTVFGLAACVTHDDGADPVCDCNAADTGGDTADSGGDTADSGADTGGDTSDTAAP